MINQLTTYHSHRGTILPGDLIAFSGRGRYSDIIRLATGSNVTHVGIVTHALVGGLDYQTIEIFESVKHRICPDTGRPIVGVIRSRLSDVIEHYDGEIWHLQLSRFARPLYNPFAAVELLMSLCGRPYDLPQAVLAGINRLTNNHDKALYAVEDYSALFCAELAAGAYKAAGVLPDDLNASGLTPACLISIPDLFADTCHQLKGAPQNIIVMEPSHV